MIATATYGSELSPEVQLLRNFRDYSIMKTKAGSNFMIAFNTWYYSFSPYVANYLSQHWVERTIMKAVLYPLIGILFLTSRIFAVGSSYPELAALFSGLAASTLIGAFYIGLPLGLIGAKIHRLRRRGIQRLLAKSLTVALLLGLTGLAIGEALLSAPLLIVSTSTIILATLFAAATFTSSTIAKKLKAC